jgi:outer membrane receptor protein involved in Fe transport
MPTIHRKSRLSLAISASLFAMVAASAAASPASDTRAVGQSAQATTQSAPTTDQSQSTNQGQEQPREKSTEENPATLSVVNVVGVRASQMRAIELKRTAPNIQDSITAESIGQLPDVTITDALQRVTGVQINREAGIGSSVDVRGLPEVGTMLNGEVFITPDQIDSQQPDFSMLPATLFRGVDVIKSPTASMADRGISGALDLHTYRPWDLPNGFTYSYSVHE